MLTLLCCLNAAVTALSERAARDEPGRRHRDRDPGGGGRPRQPDRADHRRLLRQPRQTLVHRGLPEFWLYFLGALFIAVRPFLPHGIVGLLRGPGGIVGLLRKVSEKRA